MNWKLEEKHPLDGIAGEKSINFGQREKSASSQDT